MRRAHRIGLALLWAAPLAADVPIPPAPKSYFNDSAGLVSADVARRLDDKLRAFDAEITTQVVVAIFPRLPSPSMEDFTVRTAQAWRVGQKKLDNGVVLFVFVKDRKMRLEVGYGLEERIPDVTAKRILDDVITPRFKRADYAGGLEAGIDAVLSAIKGEYRAPLALPAIPYYSVTDFSRTTSPHFQWRLSWKIKSFEEATPERILVMVYPEAPLPSIEDFTGRSARSWREQGAQLDSAVLLFLFLKEGQARFEVGSAVQEALPADSAERLADEVIEPRLRAGDNEGAIDSGVDAILEATHPGFRPPPPPPYEVPKRPWRAADIVGWSVFALFFIGVPIAVLYLRKLEREGRLPSGWTAGGGTSWGGGGFSSGGGGGFSSSSGFSGGGGSFGGGGASGSW